MEQFNREPVPAGSIQKKLERLWIGDSEILQITESSFRIIEYIDVEEARTADMAIRETIQAPILKIEGSTLDDLIAYDEKTETLDTESIPSNPIHPDSYKNWSKHLLKSNKIIDTAHRIAEQHQEGGYDRMIPCINCDGNLGIENKYENVTCMCCRGSGLTAKYPKLTLTNEATGESITIPIDLAVFVATGEINVSDEHFERVHKNVDFVGHRIKFDMTSFLESHMRSIGLNPEHTGIISQQGIGTLALPDKLDVHAAWACWERRGKGRVTTENSAKGFSPSDVIDQAQIQIATHFAHPKGKIRDDEGIVIGEEWVLRELDPFEVSLQELVATMAQHNCTLGFGRDHIETGVSNPVFYILDFDGNIIDELHSGDDVRMTLESAWLAFMKWQEKEQ